MNEISGTNNSSNLQSIRSKADLRVGSTKDSTESNTESSGRLSDATSLSVEGRALSQLSSLPEVRSELVQRLSGEVNDPEYDLDGKLEIALNKLFEEVF